jgi:hypothetical protein
LRNWKFLRFCKHGNKQGKKQGSLARGHKSGGLFSMLALGPSAHPKNARDLILTIPVHLRKPLKCTANENTHNQELKHP